MQLAKWDILKVWCNDLTVPHDKFCICLCPQRNWFYYINSEQPHARKAKNFAISIENFELGFLSHTSYVDTTTIIELHESAVIRSWLDKDRRLNIVPPSLRTRIKQAAKAHGTLNTEQLAIIITD